MKLAIDKISGEVVIWCDGRTKATTVKLLVWATGKPWNIKWAKDDIVYRMADGTITKTSKELFTKKFNYDEDDTDFDAAAFNVMSEE